MLEISNQTLHVLIQDIKTDTDAIKAQVIKTNGRVGTLEVWRGFISGGLAIVGLLLIPILIKVFF